MQGGLTGLVLERLHELEEGVHGCEGSPWAGAWDGCCACLPGRCLAPQSADSTRPRDGQTERQALLLSSGQLVVVAVVVVAEDRGATKLRNSAQRGLRTTTTTTDYGLRTTAGSRGENERTGIVSRSEAAEGRGSIVIHVRS